MELVMSNKEQSASHGSGSDGVVEVGDFYDPEIDGPYTANGGGK